MFRFSMITVSILFKSIPIISILFFVHEVITTVLRVKIFTKLRYFESNKKNKEKSNFMNIFA
uniref:Hypothetical secreted peptide n=1 Tax=Glossina morsitans morsitans TaxID=37546 RepID=D3TSS9_GLOMM